MANIATDTYLFFYQRTALHIAAREGRDYIAECLVNKEANVNIQDENGVSVTVLVMYISTADLSLS